MSIATAQRETTASHEGRHAAAALLLGLPITQATAVSDGHFAGQITLDLDSLALDHDLARRQALVTLVGYMGDEDEDWPPDWPPTKGLKTSDEHALAVLADYLSLDAGGWNSLVTEAWQLSSKPEFARLENAIAGLLEGHVLDERAMKHIHAITEGNMQRMTVKATTVAADRGVFTALAACYTIDRDNEIIERGAFRQTIARWQASSRKIPLHWAHLGTAENVIGVVNPSTMRETSAGLYVEGKLDLEDSEVAREAWRSMRNHAVGLSFGFLQTASHDRGDGVRVLTELDVYEISVVPGPSNPDTRFLSLKSATAVASTAAELRQRCRAVGVMVPTTEELRAKRTARAKATRQLRRRSWELVLETALGGPVPEPQPEPPPAEQTAALRRQLRELMS